MIYADKCDHYLCALRDILMLISVPLLVPKTQHARTLLTTAQRQLGDSGQVRNAHHQRGESALMDAHVLYWQVMAMFVVNVRQINPNWSALMNNATVERQYCRHAAGRIEQHHSSYSHQQTI